MVRDHRHCCFLALLLLLACAGCGPRAPEQAPVGTEPAAPPAPLKLLVIDDDAVAQVAQREWQARAGQPLETESMTVAQFQAKLERDEKLEGDVIYFPGYLLGELAERDQLRPLPTFATREDFAEGDLALADFQPLIRRRAMMWGKDPLVLASTQRPLVLGYRTDLLEQQGLEPPETWTELTEILRQLSANAIPDAPSYPFAQPNDATSAGEGLVARAASYATVPSRYSMLFDLEAAQPLVDQPAFVRALREMREDAQFAPPKKLNAATAMRQLLDGQVVLAIGTLPTEAADDGEPLPLAFMPLPGAADRFEDNAWVARERPQCVTLLGAASRSLGVLKNTRRQRAAWNLAVRLAGVEWGGMITAASQTAGPVRGSTTASSFTWMNGETALSAEQAVQAALAQEQSVFMPRIPGAAAYLNVLHPLIASSLESTSDPQQTLQQLAEAWREITLSQADPVSAYYRSLGLER
ncbi:MAG: extracellular solute-binding protein [Planctomycetota bacterium]